MSLDYIIATHVQSKVNYTFSRIWTRRNSKKSEFCMPFFGNVFAEILLKVNWKFLLPIYKWIRNGRLFRNLCNISLHERHKITFMMQYWVSCYFYFQLARIYQHFFLTNNFKIKLTRFTKKHLFNQFEEFEQKKNWKFALHIYNR